MKRFKLTYFTFGDYIEILAMAKEKNLNMQDAMEEYAKVNPDKIKDLGTLNEDGTMTQLKITSEGIETKEVKLDQVIEDIIKKDKDHGK